MHEELLAALAELESVLRQLDLWQAEPPTQSAMQSVEPFAVDTMDFDAWLQWLFIPKIKQLIAANAPLPQGSDVASMAEHWCQQRSISSPDIVKALKIIDHRLS